MSDRERVLWNSCERMREQLAAAERANANLSRAVADVAEALDRGAERHDGTSDHLTLRKFAARLWAAVKGGAM